jgi:general secretion pathway protein F
MPKYQYTAVDVRGTEVCGQQEAVGPEALRVELSAYGLEMVACSIVIEPLVEPSVVDEPWLDRGWRVPSGVFSEGKLSDEEGAELAGHLAELTKAGLPLSPGLRAMAAELPRRVFRINRLASALRAIADQLDAGASLEKAILSQVVRLPATVRGLLLAGIHSGRLAEALEEFVAVQREQLELRNRIRRVFAYPAFLLVAVIALFIFFGAAIAPEFQKVFDDFEAELPALTQAVLALGVQLWIPLTAVLVLLGAVQVLWSLRRIGWVQRLFDRIPVIGPMWRWSRMVAFTRLMALLLDQQVRLPDALRLAAQGVGSPTLRRACEGMAREVEAGQSPARSLEHFRQFPPTLQPLVAWAERSPSLAEAFRAAAEVFETRTRVNVTLLESLLPVALFFAIASFAGIVILALFMPMISLVQKLT